MRGGQGDPHQNSSRQTSSYKKKKARGVNRGSGMSILAVGELRAVANWLVVVGGEGVRLNLFLKVAGFIDF